MQRYRIVDSRIHTSESEVLQNGIAPGCANNVEMIDVANVRSFKRRLNFDVGQQFVVPPGVGSPLFGPVLKVRQLHAEDSCLQSIGSLTKSNFIVFVFIYAAVVSQFSYLRQ